MQEDANYFAPQVWLYCILTTDRPAVNADAGNFLYVVLLGRESVMSSA